MQNKKYIYCIRYLEKNSLKKAYFQVDHWEEAKSEFLDKFSDLSEEKIVSIKNITSVVRGSKATPVATAIALVVAAFILSPTWMPMFSGPGSDALLAQKKMQQQKRKKVIHAKPAYVSTIRKPNSMSTQRNVASSDFRRSSAVASSAINQNKPSNGCYRYGDIYTLRGTVLRKTGYDHANEKYGKKYLAIKLDKPICTTTNPNADGEAVESVDLLQILFAQAAAPLVGQKAELTGKLVYAMTLLDSTKVQLELQEIKKAQNDISIPQKHSTKNIHQKNATVSISNRKQIGYVTYKTKNIKAKKCTPGNKCIEIQLEYPVSISVQDKIAERNIQKHVQSAVPEFDPGNFKSYLNIIGLNDVSGDDIPPSLDYSISVELVAVTEKTFSIEVHSSGYTGGAHGIVGWTYSTLSSSSGKKINLEDIVRPESMRVFEKVLERFFRIANKISQNAPLSSLGLYDNQFKPPKNFYLASDGLHFDYVPYEIAPWGATGGYEGSFVVPYRAIAGFIKSDSVLASYAVPGTQATKQPQRKFNEFSSSVMSAQFSYKVLQSKVEFTSALKKKEFWKEVSQIATLQGNSVQGKKGFALCGGCHMDGAPNMGGVTPPKLDHAGAIYDKNYLIALIKDSAVASNVDHRYKDTMLHPMGSVKAMFTSDQEIADVVAYIIEEKAEEPTPEQAFMEACSRCHAMKIANVTQLGRMPNLSNKSKNLKYQLKLSEEKNLIRNYLGKLPPDLSTIVNKRSKQFLAEFIKNPQSINHNSAMPKLGLSKNGYKKIMSYLKSPLKRQSSNSTDKKKAVNKYKPKPIKAEDATLNKRVKINSEKKQKEKHAQHEVFVDQEAKLIWQDDSDAKTAEKPWLADANYQAENWMDTRGDTATTYCQNLVLAGFTDWRLPTKDQLEDLYDKKSQLKNVSSNSYWSSTVNGNNSSKAWEVDFRSGYISRSYKDYSLFVRCVRDSDRGFGQDFIAKNKPSPSPKKKIVKQTTPSKQSVMLPKKKNFSFSSNAMSASIHYEVLDNRVKFDITVTNNHTTTKGGVSVSFPGIRNSWILSEIINGGHGSLDSYEAGQKLWSGRYRQKITSDYLLLEGWNKRWRRGDSKKISFSVDTKGMDRLTVNIRALLAKNRRETKLPEHGLEDQQGYPVKQIVINLKNPQGSSVNQKGAATLCADSDTVVFSCDIKSKKLSVCKQKNGVYVYKYGKPNEIELTVDSRPSYKQEQFVRANTEATLRFRNKGYEYIVYSNELFEYDKHPNDGTGKYREHHGVRIEKNGQQFSDLECTQIYQPMKGLGYFAKKDKQKTTKPVSQTFSPSKTYHKVVGIHNDTLNLRVQPNTRSRRIGELPPYGRNIELLEYSRDGKWRKVTYEHYGPRMTGWVYGKYIARQNHIKRDDLSYDEKKVLMEKLYQNSDKYDTKVPIKDQLRDILYGAKHFCSVMVYKCTKKADKNYDCQLKIEGYSKEAGEDISWVYDIKFDVVRNEKGLEVSRVKSADLWD